jgi:hypothetical protein
MYLVLPKKNRVMMGGSESAFGFMSTRQSLWENPLQTYRYAIGVLRTNVVVPCFPLFLLSLVELVGMRRGSIDVEIRNPVPTHFHFPWE